MFDIVYCILLHAPFAQETTCARVLRASSIMAQWHADAWPAAQHYRIYGQDEDDGHDDDLMRDLNEMKATHVQMQQQMTDIKETHAQMQQQMTQAAVENQQMQQQMTVVLQQLTEQLRAVHVCFGEHLTTVGHSSIGRPPAPAPPAASPLAHAAVPAAAWPPAASPLAQAAVPAAAGDPWWIIPKGHWQMRYCLLCGSVLFDVCCFIYCI